MTSDIEQPSLRNEPDAALEEPHLQTDPAAACEELYSPSNADALKEPCSQTHPGAASALLKLPTDTGATSEQPGTLRDAVEELYSPTTGVFESPTQPAPVSDELHSFTDVRVAVAEPQSQIKPSAASGELHSPTIADATSEQPGTPKEAVEELYSPTNGIFNSPTQPADEVYSPSDAGAAFEEPHSQEQLNAASAKLNLSTGTSAGSEQPCPPLEPAEELYSPTDDVFYSPIQPAAVSDELHSPTIADAASEQLSLPTCAGAAIERPSPQTMPTKDLYSSRTAHAAFQTELEPGASPFREPSTLDSVTISTTSESSDDGQPFIIPEKIVQVL